MTGARIPIWLDCDPGQDDTVAIIIACYSKYFDLRGITTVHGNVSLKNTTYNTLRVLTAINRTDIPVFPGAAKPLGNYSEVFASDVHGVTGLNGSNLLPASRMQARDKDTFFPHLARTIRDLDGKLNIVATGPLTNIALFFKQYPDLREKIEILSVMGGGFKLFNKNGNAEFNYYCDPFAAKQVVDDPVLSRRMIQASLDITMKVFISLDVQTRILDGKTHQKASNFRAMLFELIDSTNKRMLTLNVPGYEGPVIHDPVALMALLQFHHLNNKLRFKYDKRKFTVSVDPQTYGAIENVSILSEEEEGVIVLTDLDVEEFWNEVLDVYDIADKHAFMNTLSRQQLQEEYRIDTAEKHNI